MQQTQLELNQIQTGEVQGFGSTPPEAASSSLKKCKDCKEEFEIKKGEDWKTRCVKCFISMKNKGSTSPPIKKQEVIMPSVKYDEETPANKCIRTGLTGVFVVSTHLGKVELKPEDINEIEVGGYGTRDGRLDTKDNTGTYTHNVYSVPNYELEELQAWFKEHTGKEAPSSGVITEAGSPFSENIDGPTSPSIRKEEELPKSEVT